MDIGVKKITLLVLINICLIKSGFCAAPVIHGLPTSVNVGEKEYERRLIYILTVTETNGDAFTCNTESVTPKPPNNTNVHFNTLIDASYGKYVVWMENSNPGTSTNPNVMFDYNIEQTFNVYIKCNDSQNHASTSYLEVDIIDNDRVVFTNLPDTLTLDATATKANARVYTVSAQNLVTSNDNGLTYTLESKPPTNSFAVDGNGNINTKRDLIYENNSPIQLYVTVTDGIIWARDLLQITLTNMNNIPEITNLNVKPTASVHLSELLASGSTIYTLTGSDADAGDILTYSLDVDPVTQTGLFTLDTTVSPPKLKLSTGKMFDYEKTQYYNLTLKVSDSKATGGPFFLNVYILNEDEPCYFDKSLYTLTAYEGPAGSISLNPGFIIRDNDGINLGYSLSLLNGNGSEKFTMDPTSGIIGYATEYNIDGGAMPSTVYMTAKCQDTTGQTGTAKVLIYILDINDNDPVFSQSEYTFFADQFTGIGSLIGTTTATDADSGSNGKFSCSYGTTQNAIANSFFTVGTDCSVFFSSRSGLSYDTTIRFTIVAVDKGTPARTGTAYVNAVYREAVTTTQPTTTTTTPTTTTPTTTTAAPKSTGLSDGSIAAIVIGSLVGAMLLGALLYMLFRWCATGFCCGPDPCDYAGCCRRGDYSSYPKRQITPVRSRPALQDKAYDRDTADEFNYYRDDSDYGSLKNHDIRNTRFSRPDRTYPDWPTVGEAQFPRLSPSDARVEMMSGPYSRPPAIRY